MSKADTPTHMKSIDTAKTVVSNWLKTGAVLPSNSRLIKKLQGDTAAHDPWRGQRPARLNRPRKKWDSGRENRTKDLMKRLL